MSEERTLVIDTGSGICKWGFAGDEGPQSICPSVVGRPKYARGGLKDYYIGDDAFAKCGVLALKYPIERGNVNSWDDVEKIWHHIFYRELEVDPADHPLLLTEPAFNAKPNREKATQIQFETFNVPSLYLVQQGFLSMISTRRTTGIVLEIGEGLTQIVTVSESTTMLSGSSRVNIAGQDLTAWLVEMLRQSGSTFTTSAERETVRDMKEKFAYVALDFDAELRKSATTASYTLPSGDKIDLGTERFRCPELLFKPYLNGIEFDGIDQLLLEAIGKSDLDERKELFSNIVVSGGTTLLPGFPARLQKEMKDLAPGSLKKNVRVIGEPERQYAAWAGGSIFASLASFPQMVITSDDYNETGVSVVHLKCPY